MDFSKIQFIPNTSITTAQDSLQPTVSLHVTPVTYTFGDRTINQIESSIGKQIIETYSSSSLTYDWIADILELQDGRGALACWDKTIKLVNFSTGEFITLEGHSAAVTNVIQLKNGDLVSAGYDATLKVWNVKTNECIATLRDHASYITGLLELKNEKLLSWSADRTIKIWKEDTSQEE